MNPRNADAVTFIEGLHIVPAAGDPTDHLMPRYEGIRGRGQTALGEVQVGSAHATYFHPNEEFIVRWSRNRNGVGDERRPGAWRRRW
jgi:hypothetical protein